MRFFILILFFSFSFKTLACQEFEYKNLQCENSVTGEVSFLEQFKLIDRGSYKVVVFEQGIRHRTLVLPFTQTYPNGVIYSLFCEDGDLQTSQDYKGHFANTYFEFSENKVIQMGEVLYPCTGPSCDSQIKKKPVEISCQI